MEVIHELSDAKRWGLERSLLYPYVKIIVKLEIDAKIYSTVDINKYRLQNQSSERETTFETIYNRYFLRKNIILCKRKRSITENKKNSYRKINEYPLMEYF